VILLVTDVVCHETDIIIQPGTSSRTMCYSVGCSKCGKTSWAGCGKHVPSVYDTIADKEKDLCLCKSWPDVELPPDLAAKVPQQTPATVDTACAT